LDRAEKTCLISFDFRTSKAHDESPWKAISRILPFIKRASFTAVRGMVASTDSSLLGRNTPPSAEKSVMLSGNTARYPNSFSCNGEGS
jgi:hypothetical protein